MKDLCDKKMSFQECELVILRSAVDKAEEMIGKNAVNSPEITKMLTIVENFIKKKTLICYGGTAINNILPKKDQFYNKDIEIPDYDFFSPNALKDAKDLADIYVDAGFTEVEAKAGQHFGTYKVFVNFVGIADITSIPKELFYVLKKDSIQVAGILYAPPNYLRMGMYLELSRPAGDISRWEKVLKRLTLLNQNYPLDSAQCAHIDFQRKLTKNQEFGNDIYENVKQTLVNQSVVFFGGYAISMYAKYMPKDIYHKVKKIPDFDVISDDPKTTAEIVIERLKDVNVKNAKFVKNKPLGEVIPENYQIMVGNDTIAFIYKPIACHSYNVIKVDGEDIKIATIDTMLSYYLAFLYADRNYYDYNRILCMAKYLFEVQQKNRLEQKGLLKRFSITCFGHQETVEEMRSHKAAKFKELREKRGTLEYEEWFLTYRPGDKKQIKQKVEDLSVTKTKRKHSEKNKTKKRKGYFF